MEYYFSKTLTASFDEALNIATEALKKEGFGVISEIRMHDKFKDKLNVDFKRYVILGACNPSIAYQALQFEDKIGTMLPCNILIIEQEADRIEVAAVNPIASMQAINNPLLAETAQNVTSILKKVIESI